jgi:hypothetical protein
VLAVLAARRGVLYRVAMEIGATKIARTSSRRPARDVLPNLFPGAS